MIAFYFPLRGYLRVFASLDHWLDRSGLLNFNLNLLHLFRLTHRVLYVLVLSWHRKPILIDFSVSQLVLEFIGRKRFLSLKLICRRLLLLLLQAFIWVLPGELEVLGNDVGASVAIGIAQHRVHVRYFLRHRCRCYD